MYNGKWEKKRKRTRGEGELVAANRVTDD